VVWQKMMAWDLSANYSYELLRHDLAGKVGDQGLADLLPPYPVDGLSITGSVGVSEAGRAGGIGRAGLGRSGGAGGQSRARGAAPMTEAAHRPRSRPPVQSNSSHQSHLPNLPDPTGQWLGAFNHALSTGLPAVTDVLAGSPQTESIGSNNWVVDGTLTASGKPLLANDPHLSARTPSIWYLAHLAGGDYEAIGATIPGTPAMVLGRNRFIAWGATNVAADVEDLYVEKLDATGRFAEFRGAPEPLQLVPEIIKVKGRPPVEIRARVSRHGPLVSDAIDAMNQASADRRALPPLPPLAFRWTALDPVDTTIVASMRMSEARNWSEFTSALRDFVVPSQNFVYGDVDGHIGYYAPGRIPIRASGDGTRPAPGWTGEAEWTGWVPFDELPHLYDPPGHVIVTANNRPAPADYPHLLGVEWAEPYRAMRILERLHEKTALKPADFADIQADTVSLHARALLPVLLDRVVPQRAADADAIRILRRWNGDARGDSAAAALFEAWFLQLTPAVVSDDLDRSTLENYAGRFSFVTRFLLRLFEPGASASRAWCDDRRTPAVETCEAAISTALDAGVEDLSRRLTGDMDRWRWDAVHRATFPHQGLDSVGLLRPLLSRSMPSRGDWSTVDVGAVAADAPYEQHSVAGYREIIDLSPANESRFADAVGQSGHFLSRHYDDALDDWAAVRHKRMRMDRAEVERGALGRLRLIVR
jgi:penicillin amidase